MRFASAPPVVVTGLDRTYGVVSKAVCAVADAIARGVGESPANIRERRGWLPQAEAPLYWFHGASVGEVQGALTLADLLRRSGECFATAVTATNRAGVESARRAGVELAGLIPFDAPARVARAFDRWRPQALFLVETEIWPRLILEANLRDVPVFVVSGRIYPRDLPRYLLIRRLLEPTLRRITAVLAQDEQEQQRFVQIGVPVEKCFVAGNLKFATSSSDPRHARLLDEYGIETDAPIVVAGSVHGDEIAALFSSFDRVADRTRFVVAPRHLVDGARIEAECARRNWRTIRRSSGERDATWRVLLLDTFGELAAAYRGATVAVVGGGFGAHGGHNPYEPVQVGVPVVFGPNMDHFAAEARALRAAEPSSMTLPAQLGGRLGEWIGDPVRRADVVCNQRAALPCAEAIAARYRELLAPTLERLAA